MYHVQLRQGFQNMARFNLSEQEMRAIVEPWAREQWIDFGERKWNPHQAKMTVLEGPHLPIEKLTMGRGWGAAKHDSEDVTDSVLDAAKAVQRAAAQASEQEALRDAALQIDTLGHELLALLGEHPESLLAAWQRASARFSSRSPSECLAMAERELTSSG